MKSAHNSDPSAFQAMLKKVLSEPGAATEISVARQAFREAASVLGPFDPVKLQSRSSVTDSASALTELASDCDEVPGGKWMLDLQIRREVLKKLIANGGIRDALETNRSMADVHSELLLDLLSGKPPDLDNSNSDVLRSLITTLTWLDGLAKTPVTLAQTQQALELRKLVEPFYALVGSHFRGREKELNWLRDFVEIFDASSLIESTRRLAARTVDYLKRAPRCVWGAGGIGKSSLMARFILDHAELKSGRRIPYAYLDFDSSYLDPLRPETIISSIALQLGRQYPESSFPRLSEAWGREVPKGRRQTPASTRRSNKEGYYNSSLVQSDWKRKKTSFNIMTLTLAKHLKKLPLGAWAPEPLPFLVVFDTFEEVQIRGSSATSFFFRWLDMLQKHYPRSRIVISGRAKAQDRGIDSLELKELGNEAACEVLKGFNISDVSLCQQIVQRVGGSPLSLFLAAQVVAQTGQEGLDGVRNRSFLLYKIEASEIQGQLYDRILKHIHDPELRKLAHPGLVLRRITKELIADVLAEPCNLESSGAALLFEGLRTQISLIEEAPDGSLHHRSDVRRIMLRTMLRAKDQRSKILNINHRAVEWYSSRHDPISRAEEIYHRMMLGQSRQELEAARPDSADWQSLARAWDDPLPANAKAWLAARLGKTGDDVDWNAAEMEDWEAYAAAQAEQFLFTENAEGALKVMRERDHRTANSPLFVLEAKALRMIGRSKEGLDLIQRWLEQVLQKGDRVNAQNLLEEGAQLAVEVGDARLFKQYIEQALEMSRDEGNRGGEISLLKMRLDGRRRLGLTEMESELATRELMDAFVRAPEDTLRKLKKTTADIVSEFGHISAPILERGINILGQQGSKDEITKDLEDILEQASGESEEFRASLRDIASQVGVIVKEKLNLSDVAAQAEKFGLTNEVLLKVVRSGASQKVMKVIRDLTVGGKMNNLM